jgi:hypothetical protein
MQARMWGKSNSQAKASYHVRQSGGAQGPSCDGDRARCKSKEVAAPHQRHGNWEHVKVLMLISYNCAKQAIQKEFIDLCAHVVPSKQRWEKLAKELQKKIKSKFPRNKTMCKDKWMFPTPITNNLQTIIKEPKSIHFLGFV